MMSKPNSRCTLHRFLFLRCVVVALLLSCTAGCNYFVMLGYLIGGPPQLEPIFEKETNRSLTDLGERVAVVCYVDDKLKYQYDGIDHLVAVRVAARLGRNHIDIVNPEEVRLWLEENPDWDTPDEIGSELDATFVVFIDFNHFSLYEENAQHLFRGRAECIVSVYEIEANGDGKRIFTHDLSSQYPTLEARSASDISYDRFRGEYLWRLSEEIGRMFFPYGSGDDIGSAT